MLVGSFAFAGNQGTTITLDKTASTTQTETDTYSWAIQKTLKPNQVPYVIRSGKTVPVQFLLTANRSGPVKTYANDPVSGQICIHNTGSQPTVGLWLTDQLEQSSDGGATWTAFAGPTVIPVTEIAAGASQCYPYSFSNTLLPPCPSGEDRVRNRDRVVACAMYRNIATATVDNFSGSEGTAHSVSSTVPVTVNPVLIEVDKTASISDVFTCPVGFSCSPVSSTIPLTDSYPTSIYEVSMTNESAACGLTVPGLNTATLTPSTNAALPSVSATATIYTGTCHP
jgi:hypothetical protein